MEMPGNQSIEYALALCSKRGKGLLRPHVRRRLMKRSTKEVLRPSRAGILKQMSSVSTRLVS
jgi:hypothetical protein